MSNGSGDSQYNNNSSSRRNINWETGTFVIAVPPPAYTQFFSWFKYYTDRAKGVFWASATTF